MAILYEVEHVTTYSYKSRVRFGPHRAMFLPRSGPYGRILSYSATTNLRSRVRWIIDALSNIVTLIDIDEPGAELGFTFRMRGIHYGVAEADAFPVEARAEAVPVQYTPDEWQDLSGYLRPHAEDADGAVASAVGLRAAAVALTVPDVREPSGMSTSTGDPAVARVPRLCST